MTMMRPRSVRPAVICFLLLLGAVAARAQKVPTPEEFLGFKVGADFHLATYQQAYKYFKALEQASPHDQGRSRSGKTPMGNPMIYAVITSQANMAKLDRYQEITQTLSLVKGVSDGGRPGARGRGQGRRLHRRRPARRRSARRRSTTSSSPTTC